MTQDPQERPWTQHPWDRREECCPTREPCLVVQDLAVSYGSKAALRGVSLPVHRGCITAVIGPSGCGKSTFLSSLNRLTDLIPDCRVQGRVMLEGEDVLDPHVDLLRLRRRVGMIFQKPNPFPLSVLKNLTFPLRQHGIKGGGERRRRAEEGLRQVGLWEEVKDRLEAPAGNLSGGQQQRLCLARALLLEPEVILLDEPCSALDPLASAVVEDLIERLRGRYTTIIVTHNLAQARRIADDVAMFWVDGGSGTLVEHGPVQGIFEAPRHEITAAYVAGARG
ncbi:MAG: phosphate ABC transporter ATP-binding protein [Acidobacteriota bacterium]|nr:phosphate ABC transporter ATP-binding protein [Acidobacteriota bacterium]